MQYMLLQYVAPDRFAKENRAPDDTETAAWGAYTQALIDAGVMRAGSALHPTHAATTVRVRDGSRRVQDGPYAETKEQLGGYYIIETPNLDAALEWASKSPAAASGAVEVRPLFTM
jgi:hypothetical protein